jgi:hypothetical protein
VEVVAEICSDLAEKHSRAQELLRQISGVLQQSLVFIHDGRQTTNAKLQLKRETLLTDLQQPCLPICRKRLLFAWIVSNDTDNSRARSILL